MLYFEKKVGVDKMKNSERYIIAFNRIDAAMKKMCNSTNMPFFKLIDCARRHNAVVRRYEHDLREFAELRNAIVHDRTEQAYVIAEPHHKVVQKIEQIARKITKPVTVGNLFRRKVVTLQADDSLLVGLRLIREQKFNQFPLYDKQNFIGMITAMGITYWLSDRMTEGMPKGKIPKLGDIHQHEKRKKSYRFVRQNMPIYEAVEIFQKGVTSGNRIEALLITENGRKKEKLLGIVTPMDLVRAHK